MRITDPLQGVGDVMEAYDEIYLESWNQTLIECENSLELDDYDRALQVKSLYHFRQELGTLMTEYCDEASTKAIKLIYPTLDHYETFARNFVSMMAHPVETSMLWGLLYLVFKLALAGSREPAQGSIGAIGPIRPLTRITRWLERIGHKLRASNDCKLTIADYNKIKGDTIEMNKEIIILWLNIIMTFRNRSQGYELWLSDNAWESLTQTYNEAYRKIEEAVQRIEKVAEMAERQARSMHDIDIFQRLLSLEQSKQEGATLPCNNLPVAENRKFFGRKDVLEKLDSYLTPTDKVSPLSSVALYGLGGIGKTQTALAYAYKVIDQVDAILWISAEDKLSIQQSFTRVAVDALRLPSAQPQGHQQNLMLVLDWLQKTSAKWLLVFDNVDSHDVLDDCWPVARHGAILVTTRDVLVATLPIDDGVEINEFDTEEGAKFLLHMAPKRKRHDNEMDTARKVAEQLGGLPLALNQMSAVINARSCSIEEFHLMYLKHHRRLHREKKEGWKYLGYKHGLDTVWEISFSNLGSDARVCLGVLCFFSPDSIPKEVFTTQESDALPECLSFCGDDFALSDALEELTHHALVRKNIERDSFRIHRLVQTEYRARMDNSQEYFEAATKLLLAKLPSERSNKYDDDEFALYELYIPQVLALERSYNDSQQKTNPLKPNMNFVKLLVNAANAIHDNDTTNAIPGFLGTAEKAYNNCPDDTRDRLTWAFLQSLKCMHHFSTSEFQKAELEMTEGLAIRKELLEPDDLLIALAYSWLAMAVGCQQRYEEGLALLLKAGDILDGPAGEIPTRRLVWRFNTCRNYYCLNRFDEAEDLLRKAVDEAERMQSWYQLVYGHLTFVSLRVRTNRFDEAKTHAAISKGILETSGILARFSWLSSYCAYRCGDVAFRQGRNADAIDEFERSVAIGKLVRAPVASLARCTHAYSKALATDPARQEEAERQRLEARRLRASLPDGTGGDLDDESDEAFERLVKMIER